MSALSYYARAAVAALLFLAVPRVSMADGSQLNGSMIQALLNGASSGFSGLSVTKDDEGSSGSTTSYRVNSPPPGFTRCRIDVYSDNTGTEDCAYYTTTSSGDAASHMQADEATLHSEVSDWTFSTPHVTGSAVRRVVALEPGSNGRRVVLVELRVTDNDYLLSLRVQANNPQVSKSGAASTDLSAIEMPRCSTRGARQ
jgi:hypothetical protein